MKHSQKNTSPKPKPKSKVKQLKNYISWFEIPAYNFERATAFYNHIYDVQMETSESNGYQMGYFPAKTGIGGAVVCGEGCVPSSTGPLLYLNGGNDLSDVLSKIDDAGGRVIMNKTFISEEAGYFALFVDTEGNRLALHSNK